MEKRNPLIGVGSFVWSSINWARRRIGHPEYELQIPSILVGNLQAGGSGKTPIVIALAKEAVARGMKVAVISRGYGSGVAFKMIVSGEIETVSEVGDEPAEIKCSVPEIILGVGSDRLKVIAEIEKKNPDLIIFDDGFQNLSFQVHTTILAVTDRNRDQVVYRDFDSETRYADIILGTKGTRFREVFKNENFYPLEWEWTNPISTPVWVLCAIADPLELKTFYKKRGLPIKRMITRRDHSLFDPEEVKKLIEQARQDGCLLAITEKDRVKILSLESELIILKREIKNRDWLKVAFDRTLKVDEKR